MCIVQPRRPRPGVTRESARNPTPVATRISTTSHMARTSLQIERELEQLGSLEEWQSLRQLRIDRLSLFLHRAIIEARIENDAHGWWSTHVCWAIHKLEQLDYQFPEVAPLIGEGHVRTPADVTVIAA